MKRTEFIRLSASMAAFFALPSVQKTEHAQLIERLHETKGTGSAANLTAAPIQTVRIAIIGMGNRGSSLIDMFEYMIREKMAHIAVLCDIDATKTEHCKEQVMAIQSGAVDLVSGSKDAWMDVIRRDDIDLVVVCTPWELHAEMAIAAMENGKHVAVEVPAAYTLNDCWRVIETVERTGRHHIMLENCCYNDEELWLLNMAQAGIFGDLTHAECAYIHDLRQLMMDETYYTDQWRLKHHIDRDGNLYTTHGLGPVSMYFDIGRGDYYRYLVSMSSKEAALSAATQGKARLPQQFKCGDMNTT
ncbi:MAG: Gfo/Idh/MocA family protein, partial [Flavobacteriales bacterium]